MRTIKEAEISPFIALLKNFAFARLVRVSGGFVGESVQSCANVSSKRGEIRTFCALSESAKFASFANCFAP